MIFPQQESPKIHLKYQMHSQNASSSYLESILEMLFRMFPMFRSTKSKIACCVRLGVDCLGTESRVNDGMGMTITT